MIRGITFDCWGTLVDARYSRASQRIAYLCERLSNCDPQEVTRAYQGGQAQIAQIDTLGLGWTAPCMLSLTLDALGTSLSPRDYADTVQYWEEALLDDPPELLEGVPEVLHTLRARDLAIGLISDTGLSPGRVLRRVLKRRGILHYFEHCTFSNETGVTKRRPQAFLLTLRALRVPPNQALHVGDLPETDIRGAHQVGMRTALLLQNTQHREGIPLADLVLEQIGELPERL